MPYCGANPIADMYAEKAMRLLAGAFRGAVAGDERAGTDMALAATFAGMGFGNAGVHVPHANAYPVAGRVHDLGSDFRPDGYDASEAMVPLRHGRRIHGTCRLSAVLRRIMRDIGQPSGLAEIGYGEWDIDGIVSGTMQQQRRRDCCTDQMSPFRAADPNS